MFQDSGGMPVTGGVLLAALLYAGASAFVTGPIVGERTIEKSNWAPRCAAGIEAQARADDPAPVRLPRLGCMELFGGWFGQAGAEYCGMHGQLFENNPINRMAEGVQSQKEALRQRRLAHAADEADTRCSCAVTTTLEQERLSFALYAGSLRLITPPSVKALDAELNSALASPACALKG